MNNKILCVLLEFQMQNALRTIGIPDAKYFAHYWIWDVIIILYKRKKMVYHDKCSSLPLAKYCHKYNEVERES